MPSLAIIGLVAYLSFSLGMIAGCLIMTKGDSSSEPKFKEEKQRLSPNEMISMENSGQAIGK